MSMIVNEMLAIIKSWQLVQVVRLQTDTTIRSTFVTVRRPPPAPLVIRALIWLMRWVEKFVMKSVRGLGHTVCALGGSRRMQCESGRGPASSSVAVLWDNLARATTAMIVVALHQPSLLTIRPLGASARILWLARRIIANK